ncbi:hypothetical protein BEH93_07420 [Streptomyces sp. 2R]|nr:hypothetical protein BEH93_07420 [Streptomyces sp. 2R]
MLFLVLLQSQAQHLFHICALHTLRVDLDARTTVASDLEADVASSRMSQPGTQGSNQCGNGATGAQRHGHGVKYGTEFSRTGRQSRPANPSDKQ